MKNEEEINKIKKANEDLYQIRGIIDKSYAQASDSMEDDLARMRKLLNSESLDQNKSDFFCERMVSTKNRIVECDSFRMEEIRKVDGIISDNEESIKLMEEENKDGDSSEREE